MCLMGTLQSSPALDLCSYWARDIVQDGEHNALMGREAQPPPHFLREWREHRDMTQDQLAERVGIDRSAISKIERGDKPLMENRLEAFARALRINIPQLYERPGAVAHKGVQDNHLSIEPETKRGVASRQRGARTEGYKTPDDGAFIIGTVQAGAWTEAYQIPEGDREWVPLPRDERFPGIQRYILDNRGESMNRICPDGGQWVFVRFMDLVGQGPAIGQYVIVERIRKDGLVEATAKLFKMGPDGKPWLFPDSTDPSYKPIPLAGGPDIEEIRIIGRVTQPLGRLL
jgi:transcriptional regulator with XRE-family HTH domain